MMKRTFHLEKEIPIYLVLLLFWGGLPSLTYSQDPNTPNLDQLVQVPLSPEAAAFAQNGNVPVSMYTGTPQISIPIGNISGREMNIPVSLTYDASGVKVEELASIAGLKWNLNVGGAVTRRVIGLPDGYGAGTHRIFDPEMRQFLQDVKDENMLSGTAYPLDRIQRFFEIEEKLGQLDTDPQPDIFSFSVNGMSGTIYIHYDYDFVNDVDNTTAYCLENPNLKVEIDFSPNGSPADHITMWSITSEDGTKYRFAQREITIHTVEDNEFNPHTHEYTSAWYISDIISSSGKDYVSFSYSSSADWLNQQNISHHIQGDRTTTYDHGATSNGNACQESSPVPNASKFSQYLIRQSNLLSIFMNDRRLASFSYEGMPDRGANNDRADLHGRQRIKTISFYDVTGSNLLSKAEFEHSYFGTLATPPAITQEHAVRLKLDAVRILGSDANAHPMEYTFEYIDPGNVPDRYSMGVDLWGFNNGITSNTHLVPELPEITYSDGSVVSGANRSTSLTSTQIGTLKKINYPTGGHTEFYYQLHSTPPTGNLVYQEVTEDVLTLTGGTSSTNEYVYDDDYLGLPVSPFPIGADDAFSLKDTDKPARVRIELIGVPSSYPAGEGGQYVIIYKSGTGDCTTSGPFTSCQYGNERTFAELHAGTLDPDQAIMVFDDPATHGTVWEINMAAWDEAGYRVLVLNRDPSITVRVSVIKTEAVFVSVPQAVGGLRTYKVVDRSEPTTDAMTKYYYYNDLKPVVDAGTSVTPALFSGSYSSSAILHQPLIFHSISSSQQCAGNSERAECFSVNRYASNLVQAVGPHIAYTTVTEVQYSDALGMNGFTVNQYFNEQEFAKDIPLPATKRKNGNLQKNRIYDTAGTLLEETETFMSLRGVNPVPSPGLIRSTLGMVLQSNTSFQGVRYTRPMDDNLPQGDYYFAFEEWCQGDGLTLFPIFCDDPNVSCVNGSYQFNTAVVYFNSSLWLRTDSVIRTQYFDGNPVRTETHYRYDNLFHRQLTRQITYGSDDREYVSKIFYPDDMSFVPAGAFSQQEESVIASMSKSNGLFYRISQPVWSESYVDGNRTSIQKSTFVDLTSSNSGPTDFLNILPQSIETSSGDVNELRAVAVFHAYDEEGNALDVSRGIGPHLAFLWGQNRSIPIAKVSNAADGEIAYTSFEGDDMGNWNYSSNPNTQTSKSGKRSHEINGLSIFAPVNVSLQPGTSSKGFIVSYWKQGAAATVSGSSAPDYTEADGDWTYYEHKIILTGTSNGVSVTGTGLIDELRLFPADAMMTTYCFDERSRLITTTDPNSRSNHYQYDGHNRLEEVRDFNGNLRQKVEYQLYNQN